MSKATSGTTHYGSGLAAVLLLVLVLSFLSISPVHVMAQGVELPPGLENGRTTPIGVGRVPLEKINAALRRGGFEEMSPSSNRVNSDGTVTMQFELPTPKSFRPIVEKRGHEPLIGLPSVSPAPFNGTPGTSLTGIHFDDNGGYSGGFRFIPPDPHGAVGQGHVVEVVNVGLRAFTKAGATITDTGLASFFAPLSPNTNTFDPKVVYDEYEDRFVVITLELEQTAAGAARDTSLIFLAVSDDGTPNGNCASADWYCTAISAQITDACGVGNDGWFDYPGFEIDEEAVYITGNIFSLTNNASCGSRLVIVDKGTAGGFYAGGAVTSGIFDPWTSTGGISTTTMPAKTFGAPPAGLGTFLVSYSGLTNGVSEFLQVISVNDPIPLGGISFAQGFVALGDIEGPFTALPDAPQADTSATVETNDRRLLDAVYRDGLLFATTTINPNFGADAGETTAMWAELSGTSVATMSLNQFGVIGGESIAAGTHTFFPSIAVNEDTVVAIGFSASAPTIYPGAYYTGREPADAAGVTGPVGVVEAGTDFYIRTFGGSNRWGDYSGAALDPANTDCFWITNQFATTRGTPIFVASLGVTEDGRWDTETLQVCHTPTALPVEMSTFSAAVDGSDVVLLWGTESEENNSGFEVHQRVASENDNWDNVGFVEGHGTTLKPQEYRFRIEDLLPGTYEFRLKQIDFDGAFSYSSVIEAAVNVPDEFILTDAYPNPFNPTARFSLVVARDQRVRVEVFNTLGQTVAVLHDGTLVAGQQHRFRIEGRSLPSGVYLYRAVGESFVTPTRSVTLLK